MLCSQCDSIFLRKHSMAHSHSRDQTIALSCHGSNNDCSLCALLRARFIGRGKRSTGSGRAQDVALTFWLQWGLQEEPYLFHFELSDASERSYSRPSDRWFELLLIPQQGESEVSPLSSLLTSVPRQSGLPSTSVKRDELHEKPCLLY